MDDHWVVSTDYWAVLGDSERDQWRYVPLQTIGPLDFGMSREDTVAAMAGQGFTAEQHNMGVGTRRAVHSGGWSSPSHGRPGELDQR